MRKQIKIAIVDDHSLVREMFCEFLNRLENCTVILQASNGFQLLENLKAENLPDIVLLDLNMPGMDGYETARELSKKFKKVKILILTMHDVRLTLLELLRIGVRGIITKNSFTSELKYALNYITADDKNYYYSNPVIRNLARNLLEDEENPNYERPYLSDQELKFLKLNPLDLTLKEIADEMGMHPRSLETLRQRIYTRFHVNTRTGLALVAFQNGLMHF